MTPRLWTWRHDLVGLAIIGLLIAVWPECGRVDDDCFTDSCVFARCSQELGRPCTDEDVFGPGGESQEECEYRLPGGSDECGDTPITEES